MEGAEVGSLSRTEKFLLAFAYSSGGQKYVLQKELRMTSLNLRALKTLVPEIEVPQYEQIRDRGYYGQSLSPGGYPDIERVGSRFEVSISSNVTRRSVPVEKAVAVEIGRFENGAARCLASFRQRWLPIELDQASLESLDLKPGDTFQWVPRADGIVRESDVVRHPRRFTERDAELARERTLKFQRYVKEEEAKRAGEAG